MFRSPLCVASRLVVVGLLLVANPLPGQINIERERPSLGPGLHGSANFPVDIRTGSVSFVQIGIDAIVSYKGSDAADVVFLLGGFDLGWESGERFANAKRMHLRYARSLSNLVSMEFFGQINFDAKRKLDFRGLLGAGPRVTLLDRSNARELRVVWGTAYMFEHEDLALEPDAVHPVTTNAHRWSNYLTAYFKSGEVEVVPTIYVQPRFDEFRDVRVLMDVSATVPLWKKGDHSVKFQVSWNLQYDARPPDAVNDLDTRLRPGLSVRF